MKRTRKVMGIDPATKRVGYAVIGETDSGWKVIDSGVLQLPSRLPAPQRLGMLFDNLTSLLQEHIPDCLVVEEPYVRPFGMRSALVVAQSVGVVKLAAVKFGIPVFSYTYTQAKRCITGNGAASKAVLAAAVQRLLHLPELPPWEDTIDALAFALCYCILSSQTEEVAQPL